MPRMREKTIRKSARKWEQAAERALIEIWGEKINELRGCRKNSHILLEMVRELQNQGFVYSVVEVRTKMHNLSARYRNEKQKVETTGSSPSEWVLYADMQTLLAPYKSYQSEVLLVDSISNTNSTIISPLSPIAISPLTSPSPLSSSSPLPSPADSNTQAPSSTTARRQKDQLERFFKNVESYIEKIHDNIKSTSERVIAIQEEKKEITKAYFEREVDVQNAFIEFLKRQ